FRRLFSIVLGQADPPGQFRAIRLVPHPLPLARDAGRGNTSRLGAMLTVSQLSKSFAGRVLLDDVSLQVNRGDRIGLVGPNGSGKSTLFSLILGETSADTGAVTLEKNATVGFLPQETAAAS